MAQTVPVKHAVRPPAGPPRVLTVLGAVAAAAAAVVGALALWRAPDGPVGSGLTTARTIATSSSAPAFPLAAEELTALLDQRPELGPLADPARRASCLSGLGYPAATPILGARAIRTPGSPEALVLVLADRPGDPGPLTALAVSLTCSAADTGLLGETVVPAVPGR